jgi:PAS domain S-box-containing protein
MTPTTTSTTAITIQDILRNALDGVYVIDRHRRFLLFSEACERITGYRGSELVGIECQCRDVLDCRDEYDRALNTALCPLRALFEGTLRSSRQRMRLRRKDGNYIWVENHYTPVHNAAGEVEFVLAIMRDVTEAKSREVHLFDQLARLRERIRQLSPAEEFEEELSPRRPMPAPQPSENTLAGTLARAHAGIHDTGRGGETALNLDPILAEVERDAIRRALRSANWQRNKAAQLMGISRSRLYRRMEALGIDPNQRD